MIVKENTMCSKFLGGRQIHVVSIMDAGSLAQKQTQYCGDAVRKDC